MKKEVEGDEGCATCKHWKEVNDPPEPVNECHANAPQSLGPGQIGYWPLTKASKSCGQHKVKVMK